MSISEIFYKTLIDGEFYRTLLKGIWVTTQISLMSILFGTALGALVCVSTVMVKQHRVVDILAALPLRRLDCWQAKSN